ncbi:unnamed protein product, partial [Brenthis ino]
MSVPLIKILLPILPVNMKKAFIKGYIRSLEENCLTIFITTFSEDKDILKIKDLNDDIIHGYYGSISSKRKFDNFSSIIIDQNGYPYSIIINGLERIQTVNSIIILYDFKKVQNSVTINANNGCFSILQDLIHKGNKGTCDINKHDPVLQSPSLLASTMFGQHIYNYVQLLKWLLYTIKNKEQVSIKQGNLVLAIFVDVILGYIFLQLFLLGKNDVGVVLMSILEKLVNLMYSLLKWLMGAPAGLKLNNAFNNMLGKYFLYHVELWWLFLDITGEKLDIILKFYQYLGYLGLTFQAAIISDLICIATFHSYCIYVYAARLFNIQISGLKALFRLFVGRKYNPLRGGIDSCEYTNQELFVGTVAFTILLLLLPTTVMYYIVFTMFRVLSLLVQYILTKVIYVIQTLPLYVAVLWLSQSPKIAGNILIEEVDSNASTLILEMKLFNKSFHDLMKSHKPPVKVPKLVKWSEVVSNVITGNQII